MELNNTKMWVAGVPVEAEAVEQLRKIERLPIIASHLAVMPDVHVGKGATVGSVIPTRGAIIPSSVGVDIGCGMCALETTLRASDLPESLRELRLAIEKVVPVGFNMHDAELSTYHDGLEGIALHRAAKGLHDRFGKIRILDRVGGFNVQRVWKQLGTLGGGNHFVEICLDERQRVWVMLHSGSRNVGKTIGETAINVAREIALEHDRRLPDKDLGWLDEGTPEFEEYVEGLLWAQDYAMLNRRMMMHQTLKVLKAYFGRELVETDVMAVNCHHNYASREQHFGQSMWITRKGAVSAREGELGIIPGSMGAKSFIVRGKGNPSSYCTCSHGAGRKYSRKKAEKLFTVADLERQTEGVECRKDSGVLDEIPGAYKDIDAVMAAQADLVDVVHTLKQVMCIKG
jgi:tRNA-splicing ligase RtcB (3'-phosphate/5'-hydroxy nucleic acid ligase)